jgi:hypothetical protein
MREFKYGNTAFWLLYLHLMTSKRRLIGSQARNGKEKIDCLNYVNQLGIARSLAPALQ